tara:strand:+ start:324 stop:623 length:300 start_codon:yes stop_codon:yes gene_type:complete
MRDEAFTPFVYMLASRRNGTLYTGSTARPICRIAEHKQGAGSRFTAKYGVDKLVWYEVHAEMKSAIRRELRIKNWRREWKIALIKASNPTWDDLYPKLF